MQVPGSLDEALDLLSREPGPWRPLAGGTDLMVPFAAGRLPDTRFLSLQRLEALRAIEPDDQGITLGALATYTERARAIRSCSGTCPTWCRAPWSPARWPSRTGAPWAATW